MQWERLRFNTYWSSNINFWKKFQLILFIFILTTSLNFRINTAGLEIWNSIFLFNFSVCLCSPTQLRRRRRNSWKLLMTAWVQEKCLREFLAQPTQAVVLLCWLFRPFVHYSDFLNFPRFNFPYLNFWFLYKVIDWCISRGLLDSTYLWVLIIFLLNCTIFTSENFTWWIYGMF